jgi:hypothetical protein
LYELAEDGVNAHEEDVAPDTEALLRYHWYAYGGVPPEGVEVNCTVLPTCIVAEVGLIETVGGPLTVTLAVLEVAVT